MSSSSPSGSLAALVRRERVRHDRVARRLDIDEEESSGSDCSTQEFSLVLRSGVEEDWPDDRVRL
ncbi:hypothetical protein CSUI_009882, partial [Cystoisospora suis]